MEGMSKNLRKNVNTNKKVKDYCEFNEIAFKEGKFNGVINFYIGGEQEEEENKYPF